MMAISKAKKKKIDFNEAIVHIHSTINNTIISVTDMTGNVFVQESSGTLGYKGTKKATPYVASLVAGKVCKLIAELGISLLTIKLNGIGWGKEVAFRTFVSEKFQIMEVSDVTPLPHNGCRPRKKAR